jgi:hypothetical protein
MSTPSIAARVVYWRNPSRSRTHRDWQTAYSFASWTKLR